MRGAVKAGIGLCVAAVALRYLLILFERANLYFPARRIEATPGEIGLAHEEVAIAAADGVRISGWYIPSGGAGGGSPAPGASPSRPRRGILFFHGNAGNISHRLQTIAVFHDLGLSTLIIDYRGYGGSGGRPSEKGLYLDAEAAYDWLRARREIDPDSIVAFGRSLGGAVAVELARRREVSALILEGTFTSTEEIAGEMIPFPPVRLLVTQRFDSIGKVGSIRVPKLFLHAADDEIIPFSHAERLFAAAAGPKRLVALAGGHNDAFMLPGNDYREILRSFLAGVPARAPRPPHAAI